MIVCWQSIDRRREDESRVLTESRLTELFRGLNFVRVDDQAGSLNSLIQEIWRVFLITMLISLIVEAALCLPKVPRKVETARTVGATA